MSLITRIFLSLLVVAAGYFAVRKARGVVDMVGESGWAERNFGSFGGTESLIKGVGIVMIFVGFVILVGLDQEFLGFIAGLFIPAIR